jgi:hypothetical protein
MSWGDIRCSGFSRCGELWRVISAATIKMQITFFLFGGCRYNGFATSTAIRILVLLVLSDLVPYPR